MDLHSLQFVRHKAWLKRMVERSLIVHSLRGHRRSTSSSSDASGEARSEQGWSVVGPPGKRAGKNSYLVP